MIKVKYNRDLSIYTLRLDNFSLGDTDTVFLKFDTGAVNTVIGVRVLFEYLSKNDLSTLIKSFEASSIEKQCFKSASGNDLSGYPCVVHNIEISGEHFDNFCFYLIVNSTRRIALLGDDFISHCDFKHNKQQDIIISDFDDKTMYNKFLSHSSVFELNELVSSIGRKGR